MKKLFVCILAFILLFSFASCININLPFGGDESDGEFAYGSDYVAEHLKGDYSITYTLISVEDGKIDDNNTLVMMHTDEGYYIKSEDGDEMLFVKNGDGFSVYSGDDDEPLTLLEGITYSEEQVKLQAQSFMTYVSAYAVFKDFLENNGNTTIAGRDCVKYTREYSLLGSKVAAEYCIDKETGVCLKYSIAGSTGSDSGSFQFECTEFKTSGVTLPSHS